MMPFLISTGGAFHDIDTLEGDIGSQWTNCGAPPGTETQDNSIYRHNDDVTWPAIARPITYRLLKSTQWP